MGGEGDEEDGDNEVDEAFERDFYLRDDDGFGGEDAGSTVFMGDDKKFAKRLGSFFCVRSEGILVGLPHFGGRCFVGVFSG